jgi:hypothetical protein
MFTTILLIVALALVLAALDGGKEIKAAMRNTGNAP